LQRKAELARADAGEREQALLLLVAQLLEQPTATPGEQSAAVSRSLAAMNASLDSRLSLSNWRSWPG
jgi:hypothetical protein